MSPMWPSPAAPHIGIFVRNLSFALARAGFDVEPVALVRGKGLGLFGKARVHAGLGAGLLSSLERPADILYVHAPSWFAPLCQGVARRGGKRLVVHVHGGEVYPHSRVEAAAQPRVRALCRAADLVVSPSEYYAEQIVEAFGLDPARLCVSPSGGVDTGWFTPGDRAEARARLDLPPGVPIAGVFGRIEDDKGWDVFVDALAHLRRAGREVHGLVVGRGGGLAQMQASAARQGVTLHVRGLMPQADLRHAYRALDLFLFPTRRGAEALGLVSIEAMACGVPVVASDRYAVPEYVRDGVTGRLAPPRDARAFARAVQALLAQPEADRAAMSAAARAAAERFDARRSAAALVARLQTLSARPEATPC